MSVDEQLEALAGKAKGGAGALTRDEQDALLWHVDVRVDTVRTTAQKRMMIRDAPPVLAVQLKRFTQNGFRGSLRKVNGHVAFDTTLNLAPFIDDAQQ